MHVMRTRTFTHVHANDNSIGRALVRQVAGLALRMAVPEPPRPASDAPEDAPYRSGRNIAVRLIGRATPNVL